MKLKKIIASVAACALAFGLMGALAGCGGSGNNDEQDVRQAVDALMTAIKDPSSAESQEIIGTIEDEDLAEFNEMGVDGMEFLTKCFEPVTWNVSDVTVDGKTATANVEITNVDLEAAMQAATDEITAWVETPEAADILQGDDPVTAIIGKLMDSFYASIATSDTKVTTPVEMQFVKNGSTWELSEDTDVDTFVSALYGGMDISNLI